MIHFSYQTVAEVIMRNRVFAVILIIFKVTSSVHAERIIDEKSATGYAESLFKQRDYFRSISKLKEISYFATDDNMRDWCTFKIGEAYHKSGKHNTSVTYLKRSLIGTLHDSLLYRAHLYIGSSFLRLNQYENALDHFYIAEHLRSDGSGAVMAGYGAVLSGNMSTGTEIFESIQNNHGQDKIAAGSRMILQEIESHTGSLKSVRIATILSSVVPGLGQLYAHHYYDASHAFFLTSSFAYMSFASYRLGSLNEQSHVITGITAVMTGILHYANILGARRTVAYRNKRNLDQCANRIRFLIYNNLGFQPGFGFSFSL